MCECECDCHVDSTPPWVLHFFDILPRIHEVLEDEGMTIASSEYQYDNGVVALRISEKE